MKMPQVKTRNHVTINICLLLGTIAPNLNAQGVQYAKPKNNVVQTQPHQTAPHYYTAKSNVPPGVSAVQLTCPPGMARNSQGHCYTIPRDPHRQPGPTHRHIYAAPYTVPHNLSAVQLTCPPGMARNSQGHCYTIPRDPYHKPQQTAHHASASSSHGIIFVGGKQALNPQPIPPGHAVKKPPHPGAPVENAAGH